MGSTALLDIIGSMLVGGLLLLSALRMNDQATQNTYHMQENLTVQQNMTSIIESIQWDFRKIGYCKDPKQIKDPKYFILYGDSNQIVFRADIYNDGTIDTVRWYLGGYIAGPNPRIRDLCRQVNSEPVLHANLGVTQFSLKYFDVCDSLMPTVIAPQASIPQLVELTVKVEPTASYNRAYTENFAYWRQTRLVSRNMILQR